MLERSSSRIGASPFRSSMPSASPLWRTSTISSICSPMTVPTAVIRACALSLSSSFMEGLLVEASCPGTNSGNGLRSCQPKRRGDCVRWHESGLILRALTTVISPRRAPSVGAQDHPRRTAVTTLDYLPWHRPPSYDDRPAVRDANHDLTYAEFGDWVDAVAEQLAEYGVGRGSVVALMLPNRVELLVVDRGGLAARCQRDPDQPRLHRDRGRLPDQRTPDRSSWSTPGRTHRLVVDPASRSTICVEPSAAAARSRSRPPQRRTSRCSSTRAVRPASPRA